MSLFQITFPNIGDIASSIADAVRGFFEWLWDNIINAINSLINFIWNFIYEHVINPIRGFLESAFNKFLEKLEGIIYITITVPLMVKEVKQLAEKPTFRGFIMLTIKPFITYALSKILAGTVRPYLKPISLPPVTPPSPPTIPKFYQIERYMSDYIVITDEVTTEITPILLVEIIDSLDIADEVTITTGLTASTEDVLSISDEVIASVGLSAFSEDTLGISDEVTIEVTLSRLASDEISIVDETLVVIGHSVLASDEVTITDEIYFTVQLVATLTDNAGNPLANKPIKFYYSYDGSTYTLLATVNTGSDGKATTTHVTKRHTYYKAVFEGDETYAPSEATAEVVV